MALRAVSVSGLIEEVVKEAAIFWFAGVGEPTTQMVVGVNFLGCPANQVTKIGFAFGFKSHRVTESQSHRVTEVRA
jgi:hypothetical protein